MESSQAVYYLSQKTNADHETLLKLLYIADKYHLQLYGRLISKISFYFKNLKSFEIVEHEFFDYLSESDIEALDKAIVFLDDISSLEEWESFKNCLNLGFDNKCLILNFFFKEVSFFEIDKKHIELSKEFYYEEIGFVYE